MEGIWFIRVSQFFFSSDSSPMRDAHVDSAKDIDDYCGCGRFSILGLNLRSSLVPLSSPWVPLPLRRNFWLIRSCICTGRRPVWPESCHPIYLLCLLDVTWYLLRSRFRAFSVGSTPSYCRPTHAARRIPPQSTRSCMGWVMSLFPHWRQTPNDMGTVLSNARRIANEIEEVCYSPTPWADLGQKRMKVLDAPWPSVSVSKWAGRPATKPSVSRNRACYHRPSISLRAKQVISNT